MNCVHYYNTALNFPNNYRDCILFDINNFSLYISYDLVVKINTWTFDDILFSFMLDLLSFKHMKVIDDVKLFLHKKLSMLTVIKVLYIYWSWMLLYYLIPILSCYIQDIYVCPYTHVAHETYIIFLHLTVLTIYILQIKKCFINYAFRWWKCLGSAGLPVNVDP